MKTVEEITYKYITEDNQVFLNKEDAMRHEYEMTRYKVYRTAIVVGKYTVYKLNEQFELDAMMNNDYGERVFDLPEQNSFPLFLCETHDDKYYYFNYKLLDDVIYEEMQVIDQLSNIK